MVKWIPFLLLLVSWNVQPGEKIAYFPGNFDPPHLGHIEGVVQNALAAGVSQLFIHPTKENQTFPYLVRLEMLKEFENDRIHVITEFDQRLNNGNLYFLCGSDVIISNPNSIKLKGDQFAGCLVSPRPKFPLSNELIADLSPLEIILLEEKQIPFSSSQVRECIENHLPLNGLVHETTANLIQLHQIYEQISDAKRKKAIPQLQLSCFIFEEPVDEFLRSVTNSDEISLIQSDDKVGVYRTENFIVKTYAPCKYLEFINEIWTIEKLKEYEPKTFSVPSIVSAFSFQKLLDTYYVLVEKIAPGIHLKDATSDRAFYRFGEALGELHSLNKGKNNLKFIRQNRHHKVPYSLQQKLTKSHCTNYIQFDVHGKNVLFDADSDQITLIDMGAMGFFTDKNFNPTAPDIIDFVASATFLKNCVENAFESFEEGYHSQGGRYFSDAELKYYDEYTKSIPRKVPQFLKDLGLFD